MKTIKTIEVKNEALEKVLTESNIELSEQAHIRSSYLPYFEQLSIIKDEASKINFENPTPLDEKIARDLRIRTMKVRTGSEEVKKERKRIYMLKADVEQAAWNLIKANCLVDEEIFGQVEKRRELAEAKRKAELKAVRDAEIIAQGLSEFIPTIINLGELSDADYANLHAGALSQVNARKEAEVKSELARIETERKKELAKTRIAQLMTIGVKKEGDKYILENAENVDFSNILYENEIENADAKLWNAYIEECETTVKVNKEFAEAKLLETKRLQAENEAKEKQLKEEREKAAREKAEAEATQKVEQEKAAKILKEQQDKAAKERAVAEAKAKKEREAADAKLKAEREAKEKIEAELKAKKDAELKAEQDRILAAKKAQAAPDKEKLLALSESLINIPLPDMKTPEADAILSDVVKLIQKIRGFILEKTETL